MTGRKHRKGPHAADLDAAGSMARAAERRNIGRYLHQGILQELTVAGFRLSAMQKASDGKTAAALADFATWLRDRHAELRHYVGRLEEGNAPDISDEFALLVSQLEGSHGCRLLLEPPVPSGDARPGLWLTFLATLRAVAPLLARDSGATVISVLCTDRPHPSLRIAHNGLHPTADSAVLAKVRSAVGHDGATLRIETSDTAETLLLDWAE